MISRSLSFFQTQQKLVFQQVELAGERKREEEKKTNKRKEKLMLLAFQRDDSTGFIQSPQHRQHRREMGENGCMCLFSLFSSVQILYAFEYICECVCIHAFVLCTVWILLRPNFSYLKNSTGGTCTFFIPSQGLPTTSQGLYLHVCTF